MKKAFTLAEILITLGIIGIIAALTIPGLINSYQKRKTVTQLKEAYSIMQQAIRLSQEDNGTVDSWNTSLKGDVFFNKYLRNYVKVMNQYSTSELWQIAPRKLLNGSTYSGTTYRGSNSFHFVLINGAMITVNLNTASESGLWIGIDVNGISLPNRIGKDTFLFFLSSEYGLRALGDLGTPSSWNYGMYTRSKIMGANGKSCTKGKTGYWCAALIIQDGWTIAKDYPWN